MGTGEKDWVLFGVERKDGGGKMRIFTVPDRSGAECGGILETPAGCRLTGLFGSFRHAGGYFP
jgi:predicted phage tail protein